MNTLVETTSPGETQAFGRRLGKEAFPGEIICLDGDLGCGKTVFCKGFAEGMGITEDVVSPTFTIIREYEDGRLPLYHFDVYRIGDPDEMEELGYEDYFYGPGVTLIEWSKLIEELIPKNALKILIEKEPSRGDDYRRITAEGSSLENAFRDNVSSVSGRGEEA